MNKQTVNTIYFSDSFEYTLITDRSSSAPRVCIPSRRIALSWIWISMARCESRFSRHHKLWSPWIFKR